MPSAENGELAELLVRKVRAVFVLSGVLACIACASTRGH